MTQQNFQILVVLHQVFVFAAMVTQTITDQWLPAEIKGFLGLEQSVLQSEEGAFQSGGVLYSLSWALTGLSVIAAIGLVLFRSWGRRCFTFVLAANLVLIPFQWIYIDTQWTVLVSSMMGIMEGMILALIYFSPLKESFVVDGEI